MLYLILRTIARPFLALIFRVKIDGRENIPKEGAFILCGNHLSNLDPVIFVVFLKRKIAFIAKKELFKNRLLGHILEKWFLAIPVDRENVSMDTMRRAVDRLKEGGGVGIFAQGRRVAADESSSAKSGAALFALKAGAPIVPVGIRATYKPFSRVAINIGKPVTLENAEGKRLKASEMSAAMEDIMKKIGELAR